MTLDDLAKAILTRPIADVKKPFEVERDEWVELYILMRERCDRENKWFLVDEECERPNFICCATTVVMKVSDEVLPTLHLS